MRTVLKSACRAIDEVAIARRDQMVPWLITLTYAEADQWQRRHVSAFINCVRKWAARRGFDLPYLWVAEIQEGRARRTSEEVVHYHVVLWLPARLSCPKPDKQGWWPHGFTQAVRARSALSYVMKYASKGNGCNFPRGLRLYGYGGLTSDGRDVRRWLCLPTWVMRKAVAFQRVTRLPGGLWLIESTGELVRSAWEFVRFDAQSKSVTFRRREDMQCAT